MANSLHYIKDKERLLTKLAGALKTNGRFLIIEYDTEASNQWVPYPITWNKLQTALLKIGFTNVLKLSQRKSTFGPMMYSCEATWES